MREDLFTLRSMEIYVQDIHEYNYMNGKLVDFSRSWTAPHMMLDTDVRSEIEGELLSFDRMMEEASIRTRKIARFDETNQIGRLRPQIMEPNRFGF